MNRLRMIQADRRRRRAEAAEFRRLGFLWRLLLYLISREVQRLSMGKSNFSEALERWKSSSCHVGSKDAIVQKSYQS